MREILFRGKRIDNGEWVEGGYRHEKVGEYFTAVFIIEPLTSGVWEHHRVDPSTVGQYTGLTDKNGKRIFEGDIVVGRDYTDEDGYGVVEWYDGAFEVGNGEWCGTFHENYYGKEFEVIGNIHDNPELLKEAEP